MRLMPKMIEARDLERFAVESPELDRSQRALARSRANLWSWKAHVAGWVVPRYRKSIEPARASSDAIAATAIALKDRYDRHLAELQAAPPEEPTSRGYVSQD
jgi:hypothetical protein